MRVTFESKVETQDIYLGVEQVLRDRMIVGRRRTITIELEEEDDLRMIRWPAGAEPPEIIKGFPNRTLLVSNPEICEVFSVNAGDPGEFLKAAIKDGVVSQIIDEKKPARLVMLE